SYKPAKSRSRRSGSGSSDSIPLRFGSGSTRGLRRRRCRRARSVDPMTALAPAASAVVSSDAPRFVEGLFAAARLGDAGRPMREVAVALAEAGWPVLPCHPVAKYPLLQGGFKGRSSNVHVVERWWGRRSEERRVGKAGR